MELDIFIDNSSVPTCKDPRSAFDPMLKFNHYARNKMQAITCLKRLLEVFGGRTKKYLIKSTKPPD